ncbi:MAG: DNA repair protein RecN [Lactobacillales bacterium]|jgi:DNA repair protein RecN (Recombination protein N)|nr:DNA repair protein RecN [Lactobacillales bacterium]
MLEKLYVKNFAIISEVEVDFTKGLSALIGESGAGKSILMDALNVLVGARASQEWIREGEEKASVEGAFRIEALLNQPLIAKLNDLGIDFEDDLLILKREINSAGKSICRINSNIVTVSTLKEIGSELIDIHSQHENNRLMKRDEHLHLLEDFAGADYFKISSEYKKELAGYRADFKKYDELKNTSSERKTKLEKYAKDLKELEMADFEPDEESKLEGELNKLSSVEEISQLMEHSLLMIEEERFGLETTLTKLKTNGDKMLDISSDYKDIATDIDELYFNIIETKRNIQNEKDALEFNEERYNYVNERLALIEKLKNKYDRSFNDLLTYQGEIKAILDEFAFYNDDLSETREKLLKKRAHVIELAQNLSAIRRKVAGEIETKINANLADLLMPNAKFEVVFQTLEKPGNNGFDEIEFYLSANLGEKAKPLIKTASGGERSRIMLAIKLAFESVNTIDTFVFDEIDTGVSGRVAQKIAQKMLEMGENKQVLVITHLPQVASVAKNLYTIEKTEADGRVKTSVKRKTGAKREQEIKNMLAGIDI